MLLLVLMQQIVTRELLADLEKYHQVQNIFREVGSFLSQCHSEEFKDLVLEYFLQVKIT